MRGLLVESKYTNCIRSRISPLILIPAETEDYHIQALPPAFVPGAVRPDILYSDIKDLGILRIAICQIEERRGELVSKLRFKISQSASFCTPGDFPSLRT